LLVHIAVYRPPGSAGPGPGPGPLSQFFVDFAALPETVALLRCPFVIAEISTYMLKMHVTYGGIIFVILINFISLKE